MIMFRARRLGGWLLAGTLGAVVAGGCAAGRLGPAEVAPAYPIGIQGRPPLTSLPELSTFAWILPTQAFDGATPAMDSAARRGEDRELRDLASAVLRANGWIEVEPDKAAYHLAIATASAMQTVIEERPDPRSLAPPPPSVCATRSREQQQVCDEPRERSYPPLRERVLRLERRVSFAITRVRDSAQHALVLAPDETNQIARSTVTLLQADRSP